MAVNILALERFDTGTALIIFLPHFPPIRRMQESTITLPFTLFSRTLQFRKGKKKKKVAASGISGGERFISLTCHGPSSHGTSESSCPFGWARTVFVQF